MTWRFAFAYDDGMTKAPALQFGTTPPAKRTLLHLSDTHLLADDALLGERFDASARLQQTMARIAEMDLNVDALVFTGDLTDLGEKSAYQRVQEIVEPIAELLDAPIIWVAGNHDERPEMRESLLGLAATEEPITGVWDLGGLRVIALDSSVPGWHHGDLDASQLNWLAEQLETPAPLGTILALHHPPLPSHIPFFDILELKHQSELAEIIRGSDVRAILAGHLHYATSGMFAGVPVHVASATCYTMDLARPVERINGMDAGQSFHLVHIYDDTITHAVIPVASVDPVQSFTPEWYETMAALSPAQRLEQFSRKQSQPAG